MAFTLAKGDAKVMWFPVATSQAFTCGDLVYMNGSGALIPADSTSGDHIGVITKTITSASPEYTSGDAVPVLVPYDDTEFEVDVDTGTALTAAMVGNRYDLTDANSLNVGATSKKVVTITKFISATKALVKINAMVHNVDVATS